MINFSQLTKGDNDGLHKRRKAWMEKTGTENHGSKEPFWINVRFLPQRQGLQDRGSISLFRPLPQKLQDADSVAWKRMAPSAGRGFRQASRHDI